ncbi:MAG: terpene cyclase/mutase family protein [Candidatus Bathyarchaeia archaeon]|nr:terpene cyclase/mutase family protein [Candidatus Bathyarchaeia archaeon]
MNVQKAIAFVEENGTELERYRLNYLLGKERNDEVPLRYLTGLQNDDGGFLYNNEKGKPSSINFTSANLSLMIELGLAKSDVCRKTLEYLIDVQCEDGSWDENHAINQYNPPFWNMPGDLKTKMWLTASILNYLIQLGYGESEAVRKATRFLLKNRDEDGRFFGFLHSTWISVGAFGQLEGFNSEVVKKALKAIERNIDRMEDGATDFIWCLECFHVAGISKDDPVVKRCIERLIELQRQDGAWTSADGKEYTVSTTVRALRILRMYKIW